jgi:hypothetical protein
MAARQRAVVVLDHSPISQNHPLSVAIGFAIDDLLDLCPRPILRLRGAGRSSDSRFAFGGSSYLVFEIPMHRYHSSARNRPVRETDANMPKNSRQSQVSTART